MINIYWIWPYIKVDVRREKKKSQHAPFELISHRLILWNPVVGFKNLEFWTWICVVRKKRFPIHLLSVPLKVKEPHTHSRLCPTCFWLPRVDADSCYSDGENVSECQHTTISPISHILPPLCLYKSMITTLHSNSSMSYQFIIHLWRRLSSKTEINCEPGWKPQAAVDSDSVQLLKY